MCDHRLQCREIGDRLRWIELEPRGDLADRCQAEVLQDANVEPADVEFVPLRRELRGCAVRVVIVMELLAADDDAPRHDVLRRVLASEIAIAPIVTNAVDDAGSGYGDPHHLDRPNRHADRSEEHEIDGEHEAHALPRVARIDIALNPIVRCAVAVFLERLEVFRFFAIQLGALEQDRADSARLRAVGILVRFNLGVVLAMDGDPFLRHHAGRQPKPKTEEMGDDGMEIETPMRLTPMQEDSHRRDRDMRQNQRYDDITPPRKWGQAVRHN